MKVTDLGRIFPATASSNLGGGGGGIDGGDFDSGLFPPSGSVPIANGSNTWAWGSNVQVITVNQTTKVMGPFVNIANGSNTTVTVDQVGSVASNTIRIHATSGGGSGVDIEDEGSAQGTATVLDFVGAGVTATEAGGTATITIPGGGGSSGYGGKEPPSTGSGFDPFDTADPSDPLTGWTTLGTPTSADIDTTLPSCYYLSAPSSGGGTGLDGHYKAWAPSVDGHYACIWVTDISISPTSSSYLGLLVAASGGAGNMVLAGMGRYGATMDDRLVVFKYTSPTAFSTEFYGAGSQIGAGRPPLGFRLLWHSSTSVDFHISHESGLWRFVTNFNPGFTIALAGMVTDAANAAVQFAVDYFDSNA